MQLCCGRQIQIQIQNTPLHVFSVSSSEGDLKISCILITEVQNRLLVAVPLAAWNRTLSSRILPARSLSKAVSVSLSACEPFYRTEPLLGIHTKAWVGLLNPEFEIAVELESDPTEDFHFLGEDGQILLPFAQALVEVADEKFCFATATSAAEPAAPLQKDASKGTAARLGHLEKAVEGIQTGLSNLLTQMQNMQASSAPSAVGQAPVPPATLAATPKARASGDVGSLPGLDPGVVQSALRAGVHPDHLKEFSRLIARKSGKISNLPKQTDKKKVDVLGESEDELLADGGGAASPTALAEPGDPFAAALVKLTTIVESLSDNRRRTKDLDDILDDPSGLDGGAHNLVSSGNQRRQAAVLKALQKSLLENPEQIYRKIETLMLEDFGSREAIPNKPRIRNLPRIRNKESETKSRESETKIRESETKIPRIRNQKSRESETKMRESETKLRESETENQKLKTANQKLKSRESETKLPRIRNQNPANQKPKTANQKPKPENQKLKNTREQVRFD